MRSKTKLIALDLDGTLLTSEKRITPYTGKILQDAAAQGIIVMPATGRPISGIPKELFDILDFKYAVTANGGRIIDVRQNKAIYECPVPLETARMLLDIFEHYDTLREIYYDGKDIDSMDKRELRKKIGVVLQDGGLITGSIHENITITAPNAGVERVNEVIREVGLEDDINAMPMGIHTLLMENSGTISGGQKQRIMIARAIIGRPKLIFFDEATSALDNVTQAMVNESLEKLQATKIVIAHRLSTVINCDRILVMENGKLVEEGNYEELMAKKGRFFELAARQMS